MADTRPQSFPITSTSLLEALRSPDESQRRCSMEDFCRRYRLAIYSWLRMLGQSVQDAQDHTQDFLMEKVWIEKLEGYDQERGSRFRSWLMTCLRNQAIKEHKARQTLKRGGGWFFVPMDAEALEREAQAAQALQLEPGPTFDLLLAREIWRAAVVKLENGEKARTAVLIRDLLPAVLTEKWPLPPFPSQQELADRHGITLVRLRGYFYHTLKSKARRVFNVEAKASSPGISSEDLDYLWHMLHRHGF